MASWDTRRERGAGAEAAARLRDARARAESYSRAPTGEKWMGPRRQYGVGRSLKPKLKVCRVSCSTFFPITSAGS